MFILCRKARKVFAEPLRSPLETPVDEKMDEGRAFDS
jgi:hypothetical protein